MKLKILTACILTAICAPSLAKAVSLNYQNEQDINEIIKMEMESLLEEELIEPEREGPLSRSESRLLDMKVEAIQKIIYEQEHLRPYIQDLYESNSKDAFDELVRERLGFTPEQWRELRKRQEEVDRAKYEPMKDVKINIREESLDIGSVKPIDISVVRGYASAIVFVDAAGNPWPIQGDITGDGDSYNTRVTMDHVAIIDNIQEFRESNTLVNLAGMDIPIVLKLKSNREVSDSRVIIHLPELGPNSDGDTEVVSTSPSESAAIKELLSTGGINGYREFGFNEIPGSIYFSEGWMYIRTKHDLYIPQPIEKASSPTGYNVFKIPASNEFLFLTKSGERINASISGERKFNPKHKSRLFEK